MKQFLETIKRLFCKHEYSFHQEWYGQEQWLECTRCGEQITIKG